MEDVLRGAGEVFIKPSVGSSSGRGCFVAAFEGGRDALTGKTVRETLAPLGENYVVQERLHCHASLAKLYAGSVNTFRIITYRWKDEVLHAPTFLRIGQGGNYLDNAHAGGMFIGVKDDGTLADRAFTEFRDVFTAHPDTGTVYRGYRIELFPKVLAAARRMCELLPQIGSVNWDFTLNEAGEPVLIEANLMGGGIWASEMAHGCGPFGERTAEVLRWMNLMRHLPASERHKYRYGKM